MKPILRLLIAILVVVAGYVFIKTFVNASVYAPEDGSQAASGPVAPLAAFENLVGNSSTGSSKTSPSKPKSTPANYPSRLLIPAIGTNANIQETTLNYRGAMGVPTNFTDVAWYDRGPAPGETGTAVIDGHYDNGLGLDGVFKHLGDLKQGDDIYVTTHGGAQLHFRVTSVSQIPYDDPDTTSIFSAQQERSEIKLVTCSGSWVPQDKTYNQRVVVTAELAS